METNPIMVITTTAQLESTRNMFLIKPHTPVCVWPAGVVGTLLIQSFIGEQAKHARHY